MKKTDKTDLRKGNKIEPIRITDDMILDPEMDEFLRQSMIEEADNLEQELNSDPELMGIGASDDLFFKIKARLQEMGAWEEDENEREKPEGEETEAKTETRIEVKAEAEKEARTEAKAEAKKEARTETKKEAGIETKKEAKTGAKTEAGTEEKTGARTEAKAEARTEVKTETRTETKAEAGTEAKTGARTEAKAETKIETEERDISFLLSEEDRQALELGRKIRTRRKKSRKYAAMAAIMIAVILAVGMQGDASRNWILGALDGLITATGNRLRMDYQEEQENIKLDEKKEKEALDKIKEELNIPVIRFSYKPDGMIFDKISISKKTGEAFLYYWYEETIVDVYLESGKKNSSASYVMEEDAVLKDIVVNNQKIEIKMWDITKESVESYVASFEYQDVRYFIDGRLPYEEMKKMMSMIYLY